MILDKFLRAGSPPKPVNDINFDVTLKLRSSEVFFNNAVRVIKCDEGYIARLQGAIFEYYDANGSRCVLTSPASIGGDKKEAISNLHSFLNNVDGDLKLLTWRQGYEKPALRLISS